MLKDFLRKFSIKFFVCFKEDSINVFRIIQVSRFFKEDSRGGGEKFEQKNVRITEKVELFSSQTFVKLHYNLQAQLNFSWLE